MITVKRTFVLLTILISFFLIRAKAYCQQSPLLKKGVEQYKEENYEEAVGILSKARKEDPESSIAAYFLGLAYKQTMNYEKALENFRDAVTLTPRIKEAVVELVNAAITLGKMKEAKKWIDVAEKENIAPAKIAFLKGLLYQKEGNSKKAEDAFNKAKSLDPNISQAADVQIALSYLKDRELKRAKKSFESAITYNSQSDLAGFARQYLAAVKQRIEIEKPFRFTFGVFEQYDNNMVLKPDNQAFAVGITNAAGLVNNSYFRVDYTPILKGPWLFNAYYATSSSLHDKFIHTHDSMTNSFSVTPGYNFGRYSLNLAINYNHARVRNPSYKPYLGYFNTGPLLRVAVTGNQLLEIFAGYTNTRYFQAPLTPDENRNSHGYSTYVSWVWLFDNNSFLNLRYQFANQDTAGQNWDNKSNAFSVNYAAPLPIFKSVKYQLSGQVISQDFRHVHTTFGVIRDDTTYSFSGGLTWQWGRHSTIIAQYATIKANSNIGIYAYSRNVFTLGMELRF